MKNHDIIEIAAELGPEETEKAFQLFDGGTLVWVPKSLVEDNNDGTFSMPEGLALEKDLI